MILPGVGFFLYGQRHDPPNKAAITTDEFLHCQPGLLGCFAHSVIVGLFKRLRHVLWLDRVHTRVDDARLVVALAGKQVVSQLARLVHLQRKRLRQRELL